MGFLGCDLVLLCPSSPSSPPGGGPSSKSKRLDDGDDGGAAPVPDLGPAAQAASGDGDADGDAGGVLYALVYTRGVIAQSRDTGIRNDIFFYDFLL